jgi:hypothetical protein
VKLLGEGRTAAKDLQIVDYLLRCVWHMLVL